MRLKLGQVTDTVNVSAEVQPVDTQTGTLKQLIDARRMVDLPLNGRGATQLLALVAGVLPLPRKRQQAELNIR